MSEWISVKDKLPEPHKHVLVYSKPWGINVDYILYSAEGFTHDSYVTHWMPLPELPKKEDNDEP